MTTVLVNPTFSPRQISGCALWLDGSDPNGNGTLPANNSTISTWVDKSGNGRNATTSSGANSPVYSSSERSLQFRSGLSQSLTIAQSFGNALVNQYYSLLIVGRRRDTGFQYFICGTASVINQNAFFGYRTNTVIEINYYDVGLQGTISTYTVNDPIRLLAFESLTTQRQIIVNGTLNISGAAQFLTSYASPEIGRRYGGTVNVVYHSVDVFEIICYVSNVTTIQRQQVEGYLAWKWGLQANLPTTHPYYYNEVVQNLSLSSQVKSPFQLQTTSGFLPTQIGGCALWLDAADPNGNGTVPADNSVISTWVDKSANSLNFTTISGSPKYISKSIYFQGSTFDIMQSIRTTTWTSGSTALFVVVKVTGLTNGYAYVFGFGGDFSLRYQNGGTFNANDIFNGQIWYLNGTQGGTSLPTSIFNNTSLINGVINRTGGNFLQISSTTQSSSRGLTGYIQEIILYSSISDNQRQQIEGYLAWKWGIQSSLPTSHPYYTNPFYPVRLSQPLTNPLTIKQNTLFTPKNISGLSLWLDAADVNGNGSVPANGSTITTWVDKSGNGYNGTATGTIRYSRTINNNYALSYSGTANTYITGTASNTTTTLTTFSVFIINSSSAAWARIVSLSAIGRTDNNNPLYTSAIERYGALGNAYNSFRAGNSVSYATATLGVPAIVCSQYNGTNHTLYLNGTGSTPVASTGNFGYTLYTLGTNQTETGVLPLNGSIGEVILFNSSLSTPQRQQIEGYLAWKWGLQANLPSNHPYSLYPIN